MNFIVSQVHLEPDKGGTVSDPISSIILWWLLLIFPIKKNKPTAIVGEWDEKSIKMAVKVSSDQKIGRMKKNNVQVKRGEAQTKQKEEREWLKSSGLANKKWIKTS